MPRPPVVQRLDPQAIAHKMHRSAVAVPEDEREHADEAPHRWEQPPRLDCGEHHFGVGLPPQAASRGGGKLLPKAPVVVHLAVENEHVAAARRYHWLSAERREIDD